MEDAHSAVDQMVSVVAVDVAAIVDVAEEAVEDHLDHRTVSRLHLHHCLFQPLTPGDNH